MTVWFESINVLTLTHWGRVTHICVGNLTIIGSDNGLSSGRSAPSHYLNQCRNIINWSLRNKLQWHFNRNSNIFIQENAFENVVCEMATICLGLNELTITKQLMQPWTTMQQLLSINSQQELNITRSAQSYKKDCSYRLKFNNDDSNGVICFIQLLWTSCDVSIILGWFYWQHWETRIIHYRKFMPIPQYLQSKYMTRLQAYDKICEYLTHMFVATCCVMFV